MFQNPNTDCSGILTEMVLNGTLIIDTDYCFTGSPTNSNPRNILLTENSQIIVDTGVNFDMKYLHLQSCGSQDPWESVEVRNNAILNIDNSIISGSENGITALAGGQVNVEDNEFKDNNVCINVISANASIKDNVFNTSNRGVYITGTNPNIIDFQGNHFNELNYTGVRIEDTNNSVVLECPPTNRNVFNKCVIGVKIDNGAASIKQNKFIENIVGIRMDDCVIESDIFFNEIGYTFSGIIGWDAHFDIYANQIGVTDGKGSHGIVTRGDNMTSLVRENYIYAGTNGVYSILSSGVAIEDNIDINSSTSSGTNAVGIHMLWSDNHVVDNHITVNNATAGILLDDCPSPQATNEIAHNEITADSGTNTSGVLINGNSIEQNVVQNVTLGQITDGILVNNATNNRLECNDLTASDHGLFISTGADIQILQGNSFRAPVDYRTSSRTGIQEHRGNKFFGTDTDDLTDGTVLADGTNTALFSRLLIDKVTLANPANPAYSDYFPEIDPDDLAQNIPIPDGEETFKCEGSPGPGGFTMPTDEFLCYLLTSNTLYEQQFFHAKRINIYHWVNLYMSKVAPSNWPSCLHNYINSEVCSGMLTLSSAQVQLNSLYRLGGSNENIVSRRAQMNQGLDQIKGELNAISCLDELFVRYRDVMVQLIEYAQTGELSKADVATLQETAKLCPAEYGDAVQWARSLLSLEDDQRYDLDDKQCGSLRAEGREQKSTEKSKRLAEVNIYPNPTSAEINIVADTYIGMIELYDQSGRLLLQNDAKKDKSVTLVLDNQQSGLYWIKTIDNNGESNLKKITIIK